MYYLTWLGLELGLGLGLSKFRHGLREDRDEIVPEGGHQERTKVNIPIYIFRENCNVSLGLRLEINWVSYFAEFGGFGEKEIGN